MHSHPSHSPRTPAPFEAPPHDPRPRVCFAVAGGRRLLRLAYDSISISGWCSDADGNPPQAVEMLLGKRRVRCRVIAVDAAGPDAGGQRQHRFEGVLRTRKHLVCVSLEATFPFGRRRLGKPFLVGIFQSRFSPRHPPLPDPHERAYVAFVSEGAGNSYRYRCVHLAEAFALAGYSVRVYPGGELPWRDLLARHRLIVLHRTRPLRAFKSWMKTAEALGIRVVFDIDDLLFDPAALGGIGFLDNQNDGMRRNFTIDAGMFARTIKRCHALSVSTPALAREARRFFPHKTIRVLPNCADSALAGLSADAARARIHPRNPPDKGLILGYFSGSPTHDRDFEVCADAVAEFLAESPRSRLRIVGELTLPAVLQPMQAQIERHAPVPWRELPCLIAGVDVNLVPLRPDNAFNGCKSELKFFEAALVGVVTVATDTEPFNACICHGRNGLLAADTASWLSALRALEQGDASLRKLGRAARADALAQHTSPALADRIPQVISAFNNNMAGELPRTYLFLLSPQRLAPDPMGRGIHAVATALAEQGHAVAFWLPPAYADTDREPLAGHDTRMFSGLNAAMHTGDAGPFAQVAVATCAETAAVLENHTLTWYKVLLLDEDRPTAAGPYLMRVISVNTRSAGQPPPLEVIKALINIPL